MEDQDILARIRSLVRALDMSSLLDFLRDTLMNHPLRALDGINDVNNNVELLLLSLFRIHSSVREKDLLNVMDLLLKLGASPNIPTNNNMDTPFHYAATEGLTSLCQLFLDHGFPSVSQTNDFAPVFLTAPHHAACFQILLDDALSRSVPGLSKKQIIQYALTNSCLIGGACLSSVRLLVSQYGANVNMTCGLSPQIAPHLSDLLPLSAVALSLDEDKESGYLLAKELLALGADPSAITNGYPRPLVNAIDANNTGVARAILEAGVPASSGDEDRLCSIVRAAARNAPSMIRLFLKHGVSVEGTIKNSSYGTPLIQSLISGPDCFELLLEHGAQVNVHGESGMTPLHLAVRNSNQAAVIRLLDLGADPNAKDEAGQTSLLFAAIQSMLTIVMLLLDFGADPSQACPAAFDSLDVKSWAVGFASNSGEPINDKDVEDYQVVSRVMQHGFVFPVWSKQNHRSFPPNIRKAIFTTLCIWRLRKTESYLGMLPRDLIPMLLGFIATRSKHNTWKWPKLSDWIYSESFLQSCARANSDQFLSADMKSAIEQGRCTKSVTGVEMFHQAFYQCLECFPDASRGLGCCASCAQTCHVAKGHKVVLRSFGSCFCDCSGSQMCCLESRMELVVKMRPQLYKDQPDEGILVCIKEFPADHEAGPLLPAVPGELLVITRHDLENGINNAVLRGVKGAYLHSLDYVRWISDFVVAGVDHVGEEPDELSYKKGDFVLLISPMEGSAAQDKVDPWIGMRCTASGVKEGWFNGYNFDWAIRYDPKVIEWKREGSQLVVDLDKFLDDYDFIRASEVGEKAWEVWKKVEEHKAFKGGAADEAFASKGVSLKISSELSTVYHCLGELENALLWIAKSIDECRALNRPNSDIARRTMLLIEFGVRCGLPVEKLDGYLADLVAVIGNPAISTATVLNAVRVLSKMAIESYSGRLEEARATAMQYSMILDLLQAPSGHFLWVEASFWLTKISMDSVPDMAHDTIVRLAERHLMLMLTRSPSQRGNGGSFLEAFQLLWNSWRRSFPLKNTNAKSWIVSIVKHCKLLQVSAFQDFNIKLLRARSIFLPLWFLFAEAISLLLSLDATNEAVEVGRVAIQTLALTDVNLSAEIAVLFTPSQHQFFKLCGTLLDGTVLFNRDFVRCDPDLSSTVVVLPDNLELPASEPVLLTLLVTQQEKFVCVFKRAKQEPESHKVLGIQLCALPEVVNQMYPSADTIKQIVDSYSFVPAVRTLTSATSSSVSSPLSVKGEKSLSRVAKSVVVPLAVVAVCSAVAWWWLSKRGSDEKI